MGPLKSVRVPGFMPLVLLVALLLGLSDAYDWSPAEKVLLDAITNGTFPGCSAAVTTPDGAVVFLRGFGKYVFAGQKTPGAFYTVVFLHK